MMDILYMNVVDMVLDISVRFIIFIAILRNKKD